MEIELKHKGIITCDLDGKLYSAVVTPNTYDIVGRYQIGIGDRVFDTIRMVLIATCGQLSDFYFDATGREIMHRFFLADRLGLKDAVPKLLSEQWPHAEVLELNDERYVCCTYVVPDYAI
jgi:hypothetical protein